MNVFPGLNFLALCPNYLFLLYPYLSRQIDTSNQIQKPMFPFHREQKIQKAILFSNLLKIFSELLDETSHQLWVRIAFSWSTLLSRTLCLLSTILLSIIMCSEEMSIAFQCVDNICPLGIQSLFSWLRSPAAIFSTVKKIECLTCFSCLVF